MSIDTATAEPEAPDAPIAHKPRVLRAALITVTLVAALIAIPTLAVWAWGPGRSTELWASHFGDPAIALSDGVTLPTSPPTLLTWTNAGTTYRLPSDTSTLAAAFGGPVKEVKPGTWATATGTVTYLFDDLTTAADEASSGTTYGFNFNAPAAAASPGAATYLTRADQEREARRILTALGWSDVQGQQPLLYFTTSPSLTTIRAVPRVPGTDQSTFATGSSPKPFMIFGRDGTLRAVTFWTQSPAATPTTTPIITAQQALDDLSHHRADSYRSETYTPNLIERVTGVTFFGDNGRLPAQPGPITGVTLLADTPGANPAHTHPAWQFADAQGHIVGTVLAAPGDAYTL